PKIRNWKPAAKRPRPRKRPRRRPKKKRWPSRRPKTASAPAATRKPCRTASASCAPTPRASAKCWTTRAVAKNCAARRNPSRTTATERQPSPPPPGHLAPLRAVKALGQLLALRPVAQAPRLLRIDLERTHQLDPVLIAQHMRQALLAPPHAQ